MSGSSNLGVRGWNEAGESNPLSFQQQPPRPTVHDMYRALQTLIEDKKELQNRLGRVDGLLRESKRTIERLEKKIATAVFPTSGEVRQATEEVFGYKITTSYNWNEVQIDSAPAVRPVRREEPVENSKDRLESISKELQDVLKLKDRLLAENKDLRARLDQNNSSGSPTPVVRQSSGSSPLAQELEEKEKELTKIFKELAKSERQRQDLARENERLAQLLAESPVNRLQPLRIQEQAPVVTKAELAIQTSQLDKPEARPASEIEADLEDLLDQTHGVRTDLANVRVNTGLQIQNALSSLQSKLAQWKAEQRPQPLQREPTASSTPQPSRSATPSKRIRPESPPVLLDVVMVREFVWIGADKPKGSTPSVDNKENLSSGNQSGRAPASTSGKRGAVEPLTVLQPAPAHASDLHRKLFEQQEIIMELEEKIKHLVQKKKKKEKGLQAKDKKSEKQNQNTNQKNDEGEAAIDDIGDLSVCTIDILSEDPKLLLERIRELKGKENAIQKQILSQKYDLEELETAKSEAEGIRAEYEQYLGALKDKLQELEAARQTLESTVGALEARKEQLQHEIQAGPQDPEESYRLNPKSAQMSQPKAAKASTPTKPKKLEPLVQYLQEEDSVRETDHRRTKGPTARTTQDKTPSKQTDTKESRTNTPPPAVVRRGESILQQPSQPISRGESIRSAGGEFADYFLLKEKFDEIQVFVTRIAGLMAQSVQKSRGRYASPALQRGFTPTRAADPLAEWLLASPSKSQIDADSKRFYIRFKKRFETGLKENLVADLLKNFSVFITEKCQSLLDEYDAYYSRLAETLAAVANNRSLRMTFEEVFNSGGTEADYQTLISGRDFEVVFRNVLTSALLKLAKTMTDALDKRFQDIKLRRLTVEKFMERYLVLANDSPHNKRPALYEQDKESEPRNPLLLQQYDSHLYESV